jgi:hypothetical protein
LISKSQTTNSTAARACNDISFMTSQPLELSCKIFEHFAIQVDPVIEFIQLGSTLFKDSATLVPKLADPPFWWKSNSTPLNLDPVYLNRINPYVVLFKDVYYSKYSYLETRSHCVNTPFIIGFYGLNSSLGWFQTFR